MADLLTASEKAEFFAAIGDVTDTFHKNSIVYDRTSRSFNQFNEESTSIAQVTLSCRVTLGDNDVDEKREGSYDNDELSVAFNGEYLVAQGLMVDNATPVFTPEQDFFIYLGVRYKLMNVSAGDSDFAGKAAIIVCTMRKEPGVE